MFEENIDDFYESMEANDEFELAYADYSMKELNEELGFMKLMKKMKDMGKNLIIFDQQYEM
jgi:hypothetical protein